MSSGIYNKITGYHNRSSIRLPGYDYSRPGFYFLTVCIHDRKQKLFGNVVNGKMELNQIGTIVENEILLTGKMRTNVNIDEYVIMPNHFHIVVSILQSAALAATVVPTDVDVPNVSNIVGAYCNTPLLHKNNTAEPEQNTRPPVLAYCNTPLRERIPKPQQNKFLSPSKTIGAIVRGIKSTTTKQINIFRTMPGIPIWQRNYYDHIIRDEKSLYYIRKYIFENPLHWSDDSDNHIVREIGEFDMLETGDEK